MALSDSEFAQPWLSQVAVADQNSAAALLDSLVLVSADEFRNRLQDLIVSHSANFSGPVGLYAERELPRTKDSAEKEVPIFSESETTPHRAFGGGPAPVSTGADVGSEGIVAQLISELCRRDVSKFLSHPGPDVIRQRRVRHLMIVTDIVGSGDRSRKYLNAMWQVRSVRSWWSLKLLSLGVVTYAATAPGAIAVRRHPSRPTLEMVRPCPTIDTAFHGDARKKIKELCIKYDPVFHAGMESLGHGDLGALLIFAHGAPNNVPRILHKSGRRRSWVPLFPSRVTAGRREDFTDELDADGISRRLAALRQHRLSVSPRLAQATSLGQRAVLVMAALTRSPRTEETVASRTGLTLPEVRQVVGHLRANALVNDALGVTEAGHQELKHYRGFRQRPASTVPIQTAPYYPKTLRPPKAI